MGQALTQVTLAFTEFTRKSPAKLATAMLKADPHGARLGAARRGKRRRENG